ncbi:hypothetical protein BB559_001377 [Furculomyces boomerangus]|uniref:Hexosyltransferase n=2 Tax=Harpellales TaxID=61421 RepID=A0A2T9Z265_9FUNG|nr:hypothetical protein BB559_001377 [Furculomyces boomerangus]PVZ98540.1 hypothetical protein BB558_005441 [Smittium angustum]PWA02134.1 hypothetical protein BB558_001723 [Smittium angustum]
MKAFGISIDGITVNRKATRITILLALVFTFLLFLTLNTQNLSNSHSFKKNSKFPDFLEDQSDMDFSNLRQLDSLEFNKLTYHDIDRNSDTVFIPRNKKLDLGEIFDDYLVIVPLAKSESITWLRNLYSDFNFKIMCDVDDLRPGCDIRSKYHYTYDMLPLKTFDMMKILCNTRDRYKAIIKLDFDIFLNKHYFYSIVKFLIKNSSRKIYFGDPMSKNSDKSSVCMNGKIYAFTNPILKDFCSCNIKRPTTGGMEDFWFGNKMTECINSKNYRNYKDRLFVLYSKEHHIYHKLFKNNDIKLTIGSRA